MEFSSIGVYFFLIYASIRWFPNRAQGILIGIVNSIGMGVSILGNWSVSHVTELFGVKVAICMIIVIVVYMGIMIYSLLKNQRENKGEISKAFILVIKDKVSWRFAFISLGFYCATFVFGRSWSSSFLMEVYGLSTEAIGTISDLVFLGLAIGGPFIGYLSDKFFQRRLFIIVLNFISLISVGTILYFSPISIYLLGILSFITGVCSSGYLLLYGLAMDYNHLKVKGASVIFMSIVVLIGSVIIESHLEFPFLFVLLATTGFFAFGVKDAPLEMELSKEKLEKLFAQMGKISNS